MPRAGFHTTRWTLVLAAGATHTDLARAALSELCETYWYPLYVYARRTGADSEDARDLVQSFLLSLWERDDLRGLSPDRGRFRSFLLASLKHYISNRRVHEHAQKRGGGQAPLSLELDGAEQRYRAEPADTDTPDRAFERQWALELLGQVFADLRGEWDARGKGAEFDCLKSLLLNENVKGGFSAAAQGMETTEPALRMAATRLRQRYRQLLRDTIAETAPDGAVDDELRFLLKALQR